MTRSILLGCFAIALAAGTEQPRTYGALPLSFVENQGQVRFVAQGPGYRVLLSARRAEINAIRMTLLGAAPSPRIEGAQPLWPVHYLIGRDPSKWRTNVQTYGRVLYHSVFPGIDLVFYGNERQLEYDFTLRPGADPRAIRLEIEGSKNISLSANGDLILGPLHLRKPLAYQTLNGARHEVACAYQLHGRRVTFHTGPYDRTRPLVFDPVFVYSTYLGGSGRWDEARSIAVDRDGNAYVAGVTNSADFPVTPGAVQPRLASGNYWDVFIAKLNPAGTALLYATYLGGAYNDVPVRIAVNEQGSVHVLGYTNSYDFPFVNPLFPQPSVQVPWYFLAKLSPDGSRLLYSTPMPDGEAQVNSLALDPGGNVWLTGAATAKWPRVNALQEYLPPANVYKSADRGATWQPLGALPSQLPHVVGFAVDPRSPANLCAVTANLNYDATPKPPSAFHWSTDGGRTWTSSRTPLPGGWPFAPIAFDPVNPSTLYLGTGAGIFKSRDNGQIWVRVSDPMPVVSIAVDPRTPSTLYAGTGSSQFPGYAGTTALQFPGPVYKSVDSGANWAPTSVSASVVAVDPRTPATVYAAWGNSVQKSTDGGVTWSLPGSGIASNAIIYALAIDPVATNVLYAAGNGLPNLVHKSTDGGLTWQPMVGGELLGQVTALALNPLAPSELFTAAADGISISADGARTWAPAARQLPAPSPCLAIAPSSGTLYAPLAYTKPDDFFALPAAFVAEIDASGSAMPFSTPLGGSWADSGNAIAVDPTGRVYVAGSATSPDFPLLNPLQPNKPGAKVGFLTVIAGDGSAVLSSTYLDGAVSALALDARNRAYVMAYTQLWALYSYYNFVISSVDPFAPALLYSTSTPDWIGNLAVDPAGNAYSSASLAVGPCPPFQSRITKLDPTGAVVFSLCFGDAHPTALAADDRGGLYVAGSTTSPNFPTLNAFQTRLNGLRNAFVAKIDTNVQLPAPVLQSVVGAANFRPEAVAPGGLVALFGAGLASGVASAGAIPLPTLLIDAHVNFDGYPAPLLYVSPNQINTQVPLDIAPGPVTVTVARENLSASLTVTVAEAGPGIFTRNAQGTGPGAILHAGDLSPVSDASPAHPGEAVAIYCTGLGRLRGPIAPPAPLPETVLRPEVRVAGRSAEVTYSGAAPQFVGLYQVNIEVPADTPAGSQPLVLTINGVDSNSVQVAIR